MQLQIAIPQTSEGLDQLESNLAAQLLLLAGQRTRGTQNLVNAQPLRKLTVWSMYSAQHYTDLHTSKYISQ